MFEKLLVALDGSEPSQRALAAATELAHLANAEVHVVHIAESEMLMGGGGFSGGDVLEGSRGALSIAVTRPSSPARVARLGKTSGS